MAKMKELLASLPEPTMDLIESLDRCFGNGDLTDNCVDAITNMMHLARAFGIDFEDRIMRVARGHFEVEKSC